MKLALIGKNIVHSKSPEVYRELIGENLEYSLLDIEQENDLPSLKSLFEMYDGVSITSPYKKAYISQVELDDFHRELGVINMLLERDGKFFGFNSDYLAMQEIIQDYKKMYFPDRVYILGNGSMSEVTQKICTQFLLPYKVLSRENGLLEKLNGLLLERIRREKIWVINCTSREYEYDLSVDEQYLFWDLNYGPQSFLRAQSFLTKPYLFDGTNLLKKQAQIALLRWRKNYPTSKYL